MSQTSSSSTEANVQHSFAILISVAAALGGFLFGFDTAVINGAVDALRQHFQVGPWETGLAVSLALLGSAVGALIAGPMGDRVGRTKSMVIAAVLFLASAIGSGMPFSIWDFIIWRAIGGIAVGIASVIAPAYIAEVSPAHLRGRLGSLQQLAIVVGIFVALLTNYLIALGAGGASNPFWFGIEAWKWMFWSEAPAAILYGIGALLVPESPRFLVANKREKEAVVILEKIVGPALALAKVNEIRSTVRSEQKPQFRDLRGSSFGLLPIVWVGIGLSLFQQFVGINVIFYYSSSLWRAVGFSEGNALAITVITGAINILTTLIAIAFVDKFGRKPLLLAGSAGMAITLGVMAFCFQTATRDAGGAPVLEGANSILALIAANLYVFCFGFSWGPVVWVLLGEMFNNQIRGAALSLAACAQWVANFAISTTFPPLAEVGLGLAYGLYATFATISFFFVLKLVRETKGKELEQM
ncbi:MAG: sugar porter family MFS transporter [Terrimicrobiaceae bacterium]|nr:sugar porter family MFS transporter [Terrimicrobiaceae bacterium]